MSMSKTALFMMVSLNGFMEGVNHDISWHNVDAEFNIFAAKQLDEAETLVFGRKTFEMMANFWPTDLGKQDDPVVAEKMNSKKKVVVSRSLKRVDWENSQVVSDLGTTFKKIKKNTPGLLLVLGSNNLSSNLLDMGLLDELRIMINPVLLSTGTPLLSGITALQKLSLASIREFESGNILLTYIPKSYSNK